MPRPRPTTSSMTCVYCGDEIVIAAQFLPTGAVCADCCGPSAGAPTEPTAPTPNPPVNEAPRATASAPDVEHDGGKSPAGDRAAPLCGLWRGCQRRKGHASFHTTIPDVAKRADAREAEQEAAGDPRDFRPVPDAESLVVEVEEWIIEPHGTTPVATPNDLNLQLAARDPRDWTVWFAVVLEWMPTDGTREMRDLGPTFGGFWIDSPSKELERQGALAEATAFARAQAVRLKARGPFGYRPAREIPGIRR